MASRREQIIGAILTKLGTIPGVGLYRSRFTALSRGESPAIVVRAEREPEPKRNNDLYERELLLLVEVIARGVVPDSIADQYCVSAHAKVMEDGTYGGLALITNQGETVFQMQDADLDAVVVSMQYLIGYRTEAKTLN